MYQEKSYRTKASLASSSFILTINGIEYILQCIIKNLAYIDYASSRDNNENKLKT